MANIDVHTYHSLAVNFYDKNAYTDEEINEIQSTYRSSCIKCCRKAEVEMRKLLKTEPNLNKSECKSCNNVYKNDFFFINKDKSVFDECSVCYIKNIIIRIIHINFNSY